MPDGRPNILFAFADDWGRYASCYRAVPGASPLCGLVDTPAVDRIAREGVLFTDALVPAPTCTPCRSSLLSGRYFWQTRLGAILEGAVWDDAIPTWSRMLAAAGYHTGSTYKTWGPGIPAGDPPFCDCDRVYHRTGTDFGRYSHRVTGLVAESRSVEDAKGVLDDEVRGNFSDFLADRDGDAPFCYWWGPTNTHRTWEKGSGKALWGLEPDDLAGKMPGCFPDVHDVREDVADYLGECMAFDRGLQVLLDELEARGELDRTLVVVSGDHGIPGFPRAKCNLYDVGCEVALLARLPGSIAAGTVIEDMTNLMDLAPTFLDAAGVAPDPGMSARSCWPRLTGVAGPRADDRVIIGRERHVATAREWNLPYPQRAIRTRDFLYIRNFAPERWPMGDPQGMDDPRAEPIPWEELERDTRAAYPDLDASPTKAWMVHHRAEGAHRANYARGFAKRPGDELYDLRRDPEQLDNVADDPAYADDLARLRDALLAELRAQRDPRVCEADCRYERSPYTDERPRNSDPDPSVELARERLARSGD